MFPAFSVELCRRHTLATARRTPFGRSEPMSRASCRLPSPGEEIEGQSNGRLRTRLQLGLLGTLSAQGGSPTVAVDTCAYTPKRRGVYATRDRLAGWARASRPSGARTTGVRRARADVVAFLDDDARADPTWPAAIRSAAADPAVVDTGGRMTPGWEVVTPATLGYPSGRQGAPAIVRDGETQLAGRADIDRSRRGSALAALLLAGVMTWMSVPGRPTAGRRRPTGGR